MDLEVAYTFGDVTVGKAGADDSFVALVVDGAAISMDAQAAWLFTIAAADAAMGTLEEPWSLPTNDFGCTRGGTGEAAVEPEGDGGAALGAIDYVTGAAGTAHLGRDDLAGIVVAAAAFLNRM